MFSQCIGHGLYTKEGYKVQPTPIHGGEVISRRPVPSYKAYSRFPLPLYPGVPWSTLEYPGVPWRPDPRHPDTQKPQKSGNFGIFFPGGTPRGPPGGTLGGPIQASDPTHGLKSPKIVVFGGPPLGCPYRPLFSYKIGQMPTVTRGG